MGGIFTTAAMCYWCPPITKHLPTPLYIILDEWNSIGRGKPESPSVPFAPICQVPPPLEPVHLQSSHCAHGIWSTSIALPSDFNAPDFSIKVKVHSEASSPSLDGHSISHI